MGTAAQKFEVQKANRYDCIKDYGVDRWLASPKLDGVRCIYIDGQLYTRSGKEVHGFDYVLEECRDIQRKCNVEVIDGELYSPSLSFQEIQSCVTRSRNIDEAEKKQIGFHVFALTNLSEPAAFTTADMLDFLEGLRGFYTYATIVPCVWVENRLSDIRKLRDLYTAEGYEGVMLRHPNIHYEWKRSDALLKYKLVKEGDFRVTGCFEGRGKYKGMLGGLYIETEGSLCDGTAVKLCAEVGTGFTDKTRQALWENRSSLVGETAEVAYQELTDKPSPEQRDGLPVYSLRFPVFRKFKEDR